MNWWRMLLYRWRHGHWCQHASETSRIDMGIRKIFTCDDCGRTVIV